MVRELAVLLLLLLGVPGVERDLELDREVEPELLLVPLGEGLLGLSSKFSWNRSMF